MSIRQTYPWPCTRRYFTLPNKDLLRPMFWPWPDSVPMPRHDEFGINPWSSQQLFGGRQTGKTYLMNLAKEYLKNNPQVSSVIVYDSTRKDESIDWHKSIISGDSPINTIEQIIEDVNRAKRILFGLSLYKDMK